MKDDKEHIDKLFESLNDRQFDIPEAFLDDLNKRLDSEPKRRKYFLLWFLIPFTLIGALSLGYFNYSDKPKVDSPSKLIAKNEYKEEAKSPNQHAYQPNESSQSNRKSVDSLAQVKQTSTPKNTKQHTHSLTAKLKTNQKTPAEIYSGKQTKSTKSVTKSSVGKKKVPSKGSKSKDTKLTNSGKEEKPEDKTIPVSIPNIVNKTVENTKPDQKELSEKSVPEKDSTLAQNTSDNSQLADSSHTEPDEPTSKSPMKNWKKEIQLFAGLGGNSVHDTPKNSEYLAKIKENQQTILAPSFGVNANMSYKQFTFGLGANYIQTGEKFKMEIKRGELKDSTYSELIQDSIWVQDSTGNWIQIPHDTTIYHTVQYMDSSWVSESFRNRYSWISIPLRFGYRFELGNYELIPRLGVVFNVGITQGTGRYPNISFNNTNRYKPVSFNVSYLIELEARRNIDRWFVFVNPYFRSMITPGVSGDVIRRRYSSWGIQFGVGLTL